MALSITIPPGAFQYNSNYFNGDTITAYGNMFTFTLANAAVMHVLNDGRSYGTMIRQGASEEVRDGGSATSSIAQDWGAQNVHNNGSTTSTIVRQNGTQNIYNNASAYVTEVSNGGIQNIHDGGKAYYTIVNAGGYVTTTANGVSIQPVIYGDGVEDVGFNRVTQLSSIGSSVSAQISGGKQYVYSGSIASATTVFNMGSSFIAGGGSAVDTLVHVGATQIVYGDAKNTNLYDGGTLFVAYGGTTSGTNIWQNSIENIESRGSATSTIVNINGTQNIHNQGSATGTILRAGTQNVYNDASAYVTQISSGGVQNIHDGGKGFYTTVSSGGYITTTANGVSYQAYISSGGYEDVGFNKATQTSSVASSISAQLLGGKQFVYPGSIASATTVFNMGSSFIVSRGSSVDAIVSAGGIQEVYGDAKNTNLYDGGTLLVAYGGTTSGTNVWQNSIENVSTQGSATATIVQSNGQQNVFDNGSTTSTMVMGSGAQNVYNNASAYTTVVNGGGIQNVYNNGQGYYTTVNSGGYLATNLGGSSFRSVIELGGIEDVGRNVQANTSGPGFTFDAQVYGNQNIFSGSIASNTDVFMDGHQTVYNSGITDHLTLSGGTVDISAGGVINGDVTFVSGGRVNVYSGAIVSTMITNDGKEYIYNGGSAVNTVVDNAAQIVQNGGTVNNTSIVNSGSVVVNNGGIANNVTVNDTGILRISGGTTTSVTINANGYVVVEEGKLSTFTIQNGGIVNAKAGTTIENTTVTSGGVLVFDVQTTLAGDFNVQPGSYVNGVEVIKNISLKENITENLFALLNNPDYFAPAQTTPQAALLKARNFMAPQTFSIDSQDSSYETPTTYAAGDLVAPNSPEAVAIDLRRDTDDPNGPSSFLPPGHTERVTGITTTFGLVGNNVSFLVQTGPTLLYGNGYVPTWGTRNYSYPVYMTAGTTLNMSSNATLSDVYLYNGSTINATNGTIGNLYVDNGGVANISDPSKLTGTLTLENAGKANITTSTGGLISLAGTENNGLVISGKAAPGSAITVASTINDFDGNDSITLKDIQRSDVASVSFGDDDHVTITLKDGSSVTLNITGIKQTGYTLGENPDGSLTFETCFLAGTLISTLNGVMAVEAIDIGEMIETFDWKTKQIISAPVTWVGHKHMVVKTYLSDDQAGYPVRILKDAIAENVPSKDLLITPEHCLFFDGHFVPARMLVNGRSIYYDRSITAYDYYHIETEQHSVIWANDMLTESYLDTGNRNTFANGQKIVSLFNDVKTWEKDGAAPLSVQRDIVEPIYNQINNRAVYHHIETTVPTVSLTNDPDLCLMTELGHTIRPHSTAKGKYLFSIPENVNSVQICSRTARPCDTIGSFIDDRRELGVLVGNVFIINNNGIHEVTDHLSDTDLSGWDVVENTPCRWTNGKAVLNIHSNYAEKRVLVIKILAAGPYIEDSLNKELEQLAS